jgi:lysine decarboxylase
MPGHKGSAIYREHGFGAFLDNIMGCDITEIPGADNLFQAEGLIGEAQKRYARLYGVGSSRLLVNGSSCGLIAAILACVDRGGQLIMARNSHKSIFNALTLGGISPVYAYPSLLPGYGISGPVPPDEIERLLAGNPGAGAVILPSPNYYGVCSDIESIAEITHAHGKVLIVDQAHGAHLKFFRKHGISGLPKPAEECGADIVINSIHKTLASFTQSAVMNICGGRIDEATLDDKLQCIETSSPSYPLMASLDINAAILESAGEGLMRRWHDNILYFYDNASAVPGLDVFGGGPLFDRTKLNFGFAGVDGGELEAILDRDYGIIAELYTGRLLMCMTGIGNTRGDIGQLLSALEDISAKRHGRRGAPQAPAGAGTEAAAQTAAIVETNAAAPIPAGAPQAPAGAGTEAAAQTAAVVETNAAAPLPAGAPQAPAGAGTGAAAQTAAGARAAIFPLPAAKQWLPLDEAVGAVCAASVIPYPPGIPLVCPGEKFTAEAIETIKSLRNKGEKVIGLNGKEEVLAGH